MRFMDVLARELQIGEEWIGALESMFRSTLIYVTSLADNIGRYVPSRLLATSIAMGATFRQGFLKALFRALLAMGPRKDVEDALAIMGLSIALSCLRGRTEEGLRLGRGAHVARDVLGEAGNYVSSVSGGLQEGESLVLSLALVNMAVVAAASLPDIDAAIGAIFNEAAIPAISELSYAIG